MKRCRDDVCIDSQLKRPMVSSRAESPGQSQIMGGSNMRKLTTTDALTYLKSVKDIFQDRKDKYDEFIEVMKDFKAQRIDTPGVIQRVKQLFVGHRQLILGFNTFLPKGYQITLAPDEGLPLTKKQVQIDDAFSFVGKIKAKLQGDNHVFKSFLRILNMYKMENKSISEVYQEVSELFRDHPDLLSEFALFLPYDSVAATIHDSQAGRDPSRDGLRPPMNVLKSTRDNGVKKQDSECETTLLRSNNDQRMNGDLDKLRRHDKDIRERGYDQRNFSHNGVQHDSTENNESRNNRQFPMSVKIEDHDRERGGRNKVDRYNYSDGREQLKYDKGVTILSQEVSGQKVPIFSKEKYVQKSIQELDLSNCESCTPSYRLLPKDYPIPSVSQRTDIGAEVLNDHWVSVTSGSEDYSFKHMRKNQYEESLFRCEDDRFEMDMLLESVTSTIKRVEELLDKINDNAIDIDPPILIEDHFTALNLRCIERLYGDHGLDVMDVLHKNAPLALPVILTRLKQKQEEWARCRSEFNKVWAETYSKNYHKSLDHRSFYFKQQDTKGLSTKALLAEIKEICDEQKQSRKKDVVLSIAVESRQPVIPHMEFEYPDADIHEDLFQLVKYSCGELCSSELLDKVLRIWTTFLESVFGLPSRPEEGAEDMHDVDKDNKSSNNGAGEEDLGSNCTIVANHIPSNISANRYDQTIPEQSTPSRMCIGSGINRVSDPRDSVDVIKLMNLSLCDKPQDEKLTGANVLNEASVIDKQATPGEQLGNSSTAGRESFSGPSSATVVSLDIAVERGLNMQVSDGSKDPVCTRPVQSSSERVKEGFGTQETHRVSMSLDKAEREEGELSPNEVTRLDDSVAYNSSSLDILSKAQAYTVNRHYKTPHGNGTSGNVGEHAEGGGENASRYDFSPRDSGDAEDCSPEELDEEVDHEENENKVESEGEDAHHMEADGSLMPLSDGFLHSVRPLTRHIPLELRDMEKSSRMFYGSDSFYVLFRLHQTLYERIRKAKLYSSSAENRWRVSNDTNSTDSYARFIEALHSLLDGSSDNARFEDDCRSIIGTQSYILFTLEKLIYKLVKQLQSIASDDMEMRLIQLYAYEKSRNPTGFADVVYHANARFLLPEGSNIYRIECSSTPLQLSIQLMDYEHDKPEDASVYMDPEFAGYLYGDILCSDVPKEEKRGVYLKRNKRKNSRGDANNVLSEAMDGVIMIVVK
ncbi:hypothetical protein Leryth_019931 [Lithospermum erythrorhizon]|nr:hypothetical protein Leryth_019931 [Lithospermum erythrorhizon]